MHLQHHTPQVKANQTGLDRTMVEPPRTTSTVGQASKIAQPNPQMPAPKGLQGASGAGNHVSMMRRALARKTAQARQYMLHLQQQYGNRYVQRVVASAREAEDETEIAPEVENEILSSRGLGQPLGNRVRTSMESAFGANFSNVRVHTDSKADMLNRALNARAFTTGQDIFFRQGEYNPASSGGFRLLAHELTHVVQQGGIGVGRKLKLGHPGDIYEKEADQVANAIMQRQPETVGQSPEDEEDLQAARSVDAPLRRQPNETGKGAHPPKLQASSPGKPDVRRVCSTCEDKSLQAKARSDISKAQEAVVRHRLSTGTIQGGWTGSGTTSLNGGTTNTSGNGRATHALLSNGVRTRARSWQTKYSGEWCIDGGTASVSWWKSTQYTFRHDGRDNNFLELTVAGQLAGGAKAQDLHYARSGAAVVGLIKVRTPGSTTPAATRLFTIKDGGKSAANVSTVADIEVTIPVNGNITIRIPLKATSEGELSDFSEALTPPVSHDVGGSVGGETIVDLYLAARGESTADIESTCIPEDYTDVNWANAVAQYSLVRWRDRTAPRATGASATVSPAAYARPYSIGEVRRTLDASQGRRSPTTNQPGHPRSHIGRGGAAQRYANQAGRPKSAYESRNKQDNATLTAINSNAGQQALGRFDTTHSTRERVRMNHAVNRCKTYFPSSQRRPPDGPWTSRQVFVLFDKLPGGNQDVHIQTDYPIR